MAKIKSVCAVVLAMLMLAMVSIRTPAVRANVVFPSQGAPHIGSSGYNADGTCPQPPSVDRTHFSAADLRKYGLPERGSKPFAHVNQLKTRVCAGVVAQDAAPAAKVRPNITSYTTGNDAGFHYVDWATSTTSTRIVRIDGHIASVPNINNAQTAGGTGVWFNSTLGGTDGLASAPACPTSNAYTLRAGASARKNSSTSYAYAATIQDYPDDTNPVDAFYVSAGDSINWYVRYNPWGADYDTSGVMYVDDLTTSVYSTYTNTHVSSGCVASQVASRWYSDPISNFGTVTYDLNGLYENDALQNALNSVNQLTTAHVRWSMLSGTTQNAHPDSDMTGGTPNYFKVYWDHA